MPLSKIKPVQIPEAPRRKAKQPAAGTQKPSVIGDVPVNPANSC